jgi:hypothetical protein
MEALPLKPNGFAVAADVDDKGFPNNIIHPTRPSGIAFSGMIPGRVMMSVGRMIWLISARPDAEPHA